MKEIGYCKAGAKRDRKTLALSVPHTLLFWSASSWAALLYQIHPPVGSCLTHRPCSSSSSGNQPWAETSWTASEINLSSFWVFLSQVFWHSDPKLRLPCIMATGFYGEQFKGIEGSSPILCHFCHRLYKTSGFKGKATAPLSWWKKYQNFILRRAWRVGDICDGPC